jgi:hypothetical protein
MTIIFITKPTFQTMKKTLSLVFVACLLAAGAAVAGKMKAASTTQWVLNDNTIVQGSATDIKILYCTGANDVQCAVQLDKPTNVVYRP